MESKASKLVYALTEIADLVLGIVPDAGRVSRFKFFLVFLFQLGGIKDFLFPFSTWGLFLGGNLTRYFALLARSRKCLYNTLDNWHVTNGFGGFIIRINLSNFILFVLPEFQWFAAHTFGTTTVWIFVVWCDRSQLRKWNDVVASVGDGMTLRREHDGSLTFLGLLCLVGWRNQAS